MKGIEELRDLQLALPPSIMQIRHDSENCVASSRSASGSRSAVRS
jgi:hypothetical protein